MAAVPHKAQHRHGARCRIDSMTVSVASGGRVVWCTRHQRVGTRSLELACTNVWAQEFDHGHLAMSSRGRLG